MSDTGIENFTRLRTMQLKDVEHARHLVVDKGRDWVIPRRLWSEITLRRLGITDPAERDDIILDTLRRTALTLIPKGIETEFYGVDFGTGVNRTPWIAEHLIVTSRNGGPTNQGVPTMTPDPTERGFLLLSSKQLDGGEY